MKEEKIVKKFHGKRFFRFLGVMALAAMLVAGAGMSAAADPPAATQIWQDPNIDLGGAESLATGVAAKGANIYVAVSSQNNEGEWFGQVRCYNASKAFIWSSGTFPLTGGGRTTQIALAGSKVIVAGYYGKKGSGNELVFVRAYKTGGNHEQSFQWEASTDAPYCGNYPIGVKALGSKVVVFYNTGSAPEVRGYLAGFSANQKFAPLADPTWTSDFGYSGDVSNQVNDIAIKGSQFAAVGTHQTASHINYFEVAIYSATNGSYLQSMGTEFGPPGAVNKALAVAWVGSYLGAVGQVTNLAGDVQGFFWGLKVSSHGMDEVWTDEAYIGGDTQMNAVAISGPNAYAAGFGKNGGADTQAAFVSAYNLAPGTPKHPGGDLWTRYLNTDNISTTGIVAGKKAVYLSGFGNNGGPPPTPTPWFVVAYDLDGNDKWLQNYELAAGQDTNQALGLAATSKAIVAVGQCRNGSGILEGVVEALVP
jgi:hypothetical protein